MIERYPAGVNDFRANMRAMSGLPPITFGAMSRRGFLRSAFIAAGAVGTGVALEGCESPPGADAKGHPYLYLSADEAQLLQAAGEAIVPAGAPWPTLAQAEVIRRADEELSLIGAQIQKDFHAALGVLLWAPLAYGRFSRFSKLDAEGRREILQRMMRGRSEILRAVAANVKVLVHFFYFGHPSTWKATGYDGPFSHLPPILSEQREWYAQQTGAPPAGASSPDSRARGPA